MSEMSPKGAVTTAIAALLVAAKLVGLPQATVPIGDCFDEAEKIVAEAEKRYGTIPNDPD
jgi:hypothetical protein